MELTRLTAHQRVQTYTVVVVDDDAQVRRFLASALVALGYVAYPAPDADSALEEIRLVQPDVVLCDITMPGHDGVWLVQQIVAEWPGLPIVLVTALTELNATLTLQPGVVGYLVKPCSLEDLRTVLTRALPTVGHTPSTSAVDTRS